MRLDVDIKRKAFESASGKRHEVLTDVSFSLAAGEVASLLISRMAVPVLYAMVRGREQPTVEPGPAEHRDGLTVLEGGAGPGVASVG